MRTSIEAMSSTLQKKQELDHTLCRACSDYATYLGIEALVRCQKPEEELMNDDELAFQIVHQVEELWMKLLAHALIEIEARSTGVIHGRHPALLSACVVFAGIDA